MTEIQADEIMSRYKSHVSNLPGIGAGMKGTLICTAKNKILPAFSVSELKQMDAYDIAETMCKGMSKGTKSHYRRYIRELQRFIVKAGM